MEILYQSAFSLTNNHLKKIKKKRLFILFTIFQFCLLYFYQVNGGWVYESCCGCSANCPGDSCSPDIACGSQSCSLHKGSNPVNCPEYSRYCKTGTCSTGRTCQTESCGSDYCKNDGITKVHQWFWTDDCSCHYSETVCDYGCQNGQCLSQPTTTTSIPTTTTTTTTTTLPTCNQKCSAFTYKECSNLGTTGYGCYNDNCYYNIQVFTGTSCSETYCRCWERVSCSPECTARCSSSGCAAIPTCLGDSSCYYISNNQCVYRDTSYVCSGTDHCYGDDWYDGYKCSSSHYCNVNYNDKGCCANSDCAASQYCNTGTHTCQAVTCSGDSSCYYISNHACVYRDTSYVCSGTDHCYGDDWYDGYKCSSSHYCNVNYNDKGCCANSDCASNQYCDINSHSCQNLASCSNTCSGLGYNDATCGVCPTAGSCSGGLCRYNPSSRGSGPWYDCGSTNCCCFNSESCDCTGGDECNTFGCQEAPTINSLTANPTSGPAPLTVSFSGSCTNNTVNPVSYSWDFDNSNGIQNEASGSNPIHIYNNPGTYTVTMSCSGSPTSSRTIIIYVECRGNNVCGRYHEDSTLTPGPDSIGYGDDNARCDAEDEGNDYTRKQSCTDHVGCFNDFQTSDVYYDYCLSEYPNCNVNGCSCSEDCVEDKTDSNYGKCCECSSGGTCSCPASGNCVCIGGGVLSYPNPSCGEYVYEYKVEGTGNLAYCPSDEPDNSFNCASLGVNYICSNGACMIPSITSTTTTITTTTIAILCDDSCSNLGYSEETCDETVAIPSCANGQCRYEGEQSPDITECSSYCYCWNQVACNCGEDTCDTTSPYCHVSETTTTIPTTTTTICLNFRRICKSYTSTEWNTKYPNHDISMCGSGCRLGETYYACEPNDADTACCPDENCVYGGICYPDGTLADVDNDGFDEICVGGSNGEWEEDEGGDTTTTIQTTTTTDSGPTPCVDDNDCECYEDCRSSFCFDIRTETSGCNYYDGCNDGVCATNELCFPRGEAIVQACKELPDFCHALRTCPWSE